MLWLRLRRAASLRLGVKPFAPRQSDFTGVVALLLERYNAAALIVLVVLPLAMTLALIWKTKEVILESVFGTEHPPTSEN